VVVTVAFDLTLRRNPNDEVELLAENTDSAQAKATDAVCKLTRQ
jgi:hypothetical protein